MFLYSVVSRVRHHRYYLYDYFNRHQITIFEAKMPIRFPKQHLPNYPPFAIA